VQLSIAKAKALAYLEAKADDCSAIYLRVRGYHSLTEVAAGLEDET